MTSDQETRLLRRAAAGETDAFRVLFESHRDGVFRLAYHLTSVQDVAEDITQECFLTLIRHAARFDPERGSIRQYLGGMARNLARRHWQAAGRVLPLDEESEGDFGAQLPAAIESGEVSSAVQAAIETLPVLQREALVLFEFEEQSLEEIAASAGCDAGTVKSRLHRARARLRRLLAPCWNQLRSGTDDDRLPAAAKSRQGAGPVSPKRSLP